jgi:peptidoglycan/LPS O-acetylase OafA/YrhL
VEYHNLRSSLLDGGLRLGSGSVLTRVIPPFSQGDRQQARWAAGASGGLQEKLRTFWGVWRTSSRHKAGAPELEYRADVDGLRAIAVLAVVAFHASPRLVPAGFVGVDIFFVISGFLISSLIVNRLKDGNFSFLEFYGRRIRRLFPALALVLLVTWGIGWFALFPADFAPLGRHMQAAAAFAANILNYFEAGYWDAPATSKPLLHIWSLGVEEQFYLVFPALLLLAWRFRAMTWLLVLTGIASFALNIALVGAHQSFTFYLPFTRFWEFVAGALFACTNLGKDRGGMPALSALSAPRWRDCSAAIGMLLIVAGITFASETSFPGWWAFLPVFGSFFIIGAGPQAWLNRRALARPALVFIGLISYPLYLWHWPFLAIGRTVMAAYDNRYERTTTIVAVILAFVLAWLTFEFIERPVRARKPVFAARRITAALAIVMASVALLGFVTMHFDGLLIRYPKEIQALLTPSDVYTDYVPNQQPAYPSVDPSNSSVGPLVVTYGDSHAWHLQAGLRRLQHERPFRLQPKWWNLPCVPIVAEPLVKRSDEDTCRAMLAAEQRYFEQTKPDIVVVAGYWLRYQQRDKLTEILRSLQQAGVPRIVVVGSVPHWFQFPQLTLYQAYMRDPMHKIPERLFGFAKETFAIDRQLQEITANLGVRYISASDVLCSENGCLARLGDAAKDIVQFDKTHLSPVGSWYFVSHIADQIFD